jgi:hypothetical protein
MIFLAGLVRSLVIRMGRQLRVGRRGGLGGRGSEGIRTHDDAFAVAGHHQDVGILPGGCLPLCVEGVEVDGGATGEVFNLAFTQLLAGAAFDGFHGRVERVPGCFDGGELS